MTMKADLLEVLRKRWLTPLTALEACGCLSLSQRVGELKREGVNVMDMWVKLPNGKTVKAYHVLQ